MPLIGNNKLATLFRSIVHACIVLGFIPNTVFPCGSGGLKDSVTLILGKVGMSAQHWHFDHKFDKYRPMKNNKSEHKEFHGASCLINPSLEPMTIEIITHGIPTTVIIPPLSAFIFRGDLLHAGSANKRG